MSDGALGRSAKPGDRPLLQRATGGNGSIGRSSLPEIGQGADIRTPQAAAGNNKHPLAAVSGRTFEPLRRESTHLPHQMCAAGPGLNCLSNRPC
jgi:hypothetical protein